MGAPPAWILGDISAVLGPGDGDVVGESKGPGITL